MTTADIFAAKIFKIFKKFLDTLHFALIMGFVF